MINNSSDNNPYKNFFPLMRLKATLIKMARYKIKKKHRYIYLNPIEGVLISYKTQAKFPHEPNNIVNLKQIVNVEFLKEQKWYFTKGNYYFKVTSPEKKHIFFSDNLDVTLFWVEKIKEAKKFYEWLQKIVALRYEINQSDEDYQEKADQLINQVLLLTIPEIDMGQYTLRSGMSANDYAEHKAKEFIS